jgi:hypothetical protein
MIEVCFGPHDVDDKFGGTVFPELCHIVNMMDRDKVTNPYLVTIPVCRQMWMYSLYRTTGERHLLLDNTLGPWVGISSMV